MHSNSLPPGFHWVGDPLKEPPSHSKRESLEMRIYNDKWETYALLRSFHIPSSHAKEALS